MLLVCLERNDFRQHAGNRLTPSKGRRRPQAEARARQECRAQLLAGLAVASSPEAVSYYRSAL